MSFNYKWTLADANFTKDKGKVFFFCEKKQRKRQRKKLIKDVAKKLKNSN